MKVSPGQQVCLSIYGELLQVTKCRLPPKVVLKKIVGPKQKRAPTGTAEPMVCFSIPGLHVHIYLTKKNNPLIKSGKKTKVLLPIFCFLLTSLEVSEGSPLQMESSLSIMLSANTI